MESKVSARLKQPLAREVLEHLFLPRLNREFFANFDMLTQINLAHLLMLRERGIVDHDAARRLARALLQMQADGPHAVELDAAREEAYFNYEAHLIKAVGQELGGRLHTARSRNDIGATIDRMRARDFTARIGSALIGVSRAALAQAERYADCVMPGYTHMQAAQPITYGYYLSALVDAWSRDIGRLAHVLETADASPLGACALAGTSFPIDRERVAKTLGFDGVCRNSLDAVSDRDFAIEFCAAGALIMTHVSRLSEELVLWMSPRVGFIDLADRFCTGSSIMPQKKNPDVPELARGKTGRVNGNLVALLTLMKGQPLAYNKDNQEDKEGLFDTVDTVRDTLTIFADMAAGIKVKADNMRAAALQGFATATDLADYLVKRGVPFRDAHEVVAHAVRDCEQRGCDLADLSLDELKAYHPTIGDDVHQVLTLEGSVAARKHVGGTAPERVAEEARRVLQETAAQ